MFFLPGSPPVLEQNNHMQIEIAVYRIPIVNVTLVVSSYYVPGSVGAMSCSSSSSVTTFFCFLRFLVVSSNVLIGMYEVCLLDPFPRPSSVAKKSGGSP